MREWRDSMAENKDLCIDVINVIYAQTVVATNGLVKLIKKVSEQKTTNEDEAQFWFLFQYQLQRYLKKLKKFRKWMEKNIVLAFKGEKVIPCKMAKKIFARYTKIKDVLDNVMALISGEDKNETEQTTE